MFFAGHQFHRFILVIVITHRVSEIKSFVRNFYFYFYFVVDSVECLHKLRS